MIHAFIKYCMILNGTMCQTLEIVPVDHRIVSIIECYRGGAMGSSAEFTLNGIRWRVKGIYCRETPSEVQQWVSDWKGRP